MYSLIFDLNQISAKTRDSSDTWQNLKARTPTVTDRLWSKGQIQFQSIYFEYVDRTFFMIFEKMVVFGHFWKISIEKIG